ncbi:AEC family transporter [Cellvibrio sp. NN19]|uniref:AEC family transporter n=1 Tax=Cellvibrio chitinivorans TaxID=3102792 RepID=UPI002B401850|nr:AEC family transporter [Cellvibrio sp. NN19]
MSNIAVVVIALIIGLLLQKAKRFPENAAATLNLYVIYVALPALVLAEIPKLSYTHEALIPVIAAWMVMLFSASLTWCTARALKWSRELTGALMLLVPLGNTGFVGIPLIEAHLGAQAIPYAILYDQLGTFIALNTYGIVVACYYSSGSTSIAKIVRSIMAFPPFIALILAFGVSFFSYPDWLAEALARISSTLVPVVMVAVGLQWRLSMSAEHFSPLLVGLVYILFISPLFVLLGLRLFDVDGLVARVVILEAAMPAMISAGVLAISHNLLPRFASSLVGYSLLAGLVSVWLWRLVI